MDEAHRQAYLKAMGIESYIPRFVLPGAAPSRQSEGPRWRCSPEKPPVATEKTGDVAPCTPDIPHESAGTAVKPAPNRAGEPTGSTPAGGQKDSEQQEAGKHEQPVRFKLALARVGEALCVINQLPHDGGDRFTETHGRLLRNLLQARGIDSADVRFETEPFRWPFAEDPRLDRGPEAAGQALTAYLQQKMSDRPFRVLLILGRMPATVLGRAGESGADALPGSVVVTRSLDEMLSFPALKAEVWRDLAPLERELAD